MLEPAERQLFLEALRPPEGYEIDEVIGTTYSLDLTALLIAPLAFTIFEYRDRKGDLKPDPLAVLEALRRHSGQITVFCQAARMGVPRGHRLLHSYLEESVFEVALKNGGAFHPKLWVLRFRREGAPAAWRVLVLTRNLTFDRCWDAMVVCDGTQSGRATTRQGERLAGFVREVLALARAVPESKSQHIVEVCQQLQGVTFEVPEGFESLDFRPITPKESRTWPFGKADRFAVVSPFLSQSTVSRLMKSCSECLIVSRIDALKTLDPKALIADKDTHCYFVTERALPDDDESSNSLDEDRLLSGLHAKVFVADEGSASRVWIGSANATESAFNRNVEFLIELGGHRKECGVDALMNAPDGEASFRNLLEEFTPDPNATAETGSDAEQQLDAAWRDIAAAHLVAQIQPASSLTYNSELSVAAPLNLGTVEATCRPVTLPEPAAVKFANDKILGRFENISLEAITPFIAVDLVFPPTGDCRRFVVKAELEGAPEGRAQAILARLLESREQIIRYLMFLLSDEIVQGGGNNPVLIDGDESVWTRSAADSPALLEALVRALANNPAKLDHIGRLLTDLKPEDKPDVLKDLQTIWAPIAAAREALK